MVADLGGGTFDVCFVRKMIEFDEIHLLFSAGHERLGGDDLDQALADWVLKGLEEDLKAQKKWPFPASDRKKLGLLCRKAKERLSSAESAEVAFAGFKVNVTRDDFRIACVDVIKKMLEPIHTASSMSGVKLAFESLAVRTMEKASELKTSDKKLSNEDRNRTSKSFKETYKNRELEFTDRAPFIDEVVCIGAATWAPAVRELLQLVSGCEPSNTVIDPEGAVALGAAILANIVDLNMEDMQVHSAWRTAWTKYLLDNPSAMKRMTAAQEAGESSALPPVDDEAESRIPSALQQ